VADQDQATHPPLESGHVDGLPTLLEMLRATLILEHFAQICSRWLGLGEGNVRLRRICKRSGIFCPWLRCCSVVDVNPLHRNALPCPKSSRSTSYTFSQTALNEARLRFSTTASPGWNQDLGESAFVRRPGFHPHEELGSSAMRRVSEIDRNAGRRTLRGHSGTHRRP